MAKAGKPTIFTQELADRICEVVATHTKSTKKLSAMFDWMPNDSTIYEWRYRNEKFASQYACAKARQAELYAEETMDIADDGLNDSYVDEDGRVRTEHDVVSRSKLRIDTRKWYASKLAPKIWGDSAGKNNDQGDQRSAVERLMERLEGEGT